MSFPHRRYQTAPVFPLVAPKRAAAQESTVSLMSWSRSGRENLRAIVSPSGSTTHSTGKAMASSSPMVASTASGAASSPGRTATRRLATAS